MKRKQSSRYQGLRRAAVCAVFAAVVAAMFYVPWGKSSEAAEVLGRNSLAMNRRFLKDVDLNASRALNGTRQATSAQTAALNALRSTAPNMTARWNEFGGSPDVIRGFASEPLGGTAEEAGRAFIQQNTALFGVTDMANLRVVRNSDALGGHLLRFQQTFGGVDVTGGGIGLVLNGNNQVIMASGPNFRDVAVNTTPTLSAVQARQAVNTHLGNYQINVPQNLQNLAQPALNALTEKIGPVNQLEPKLGIYPTADGYKLVWKVAAFSINPFGLFLVQIDAHTGAVVSRKDYIDFQQAPLPYTADIFPKYPRITPQLKDQSIIAVCGNKPCDQERVSLRAFDQQNLVTGLTGTLTGTHAAVTNTLATRQPFAQAALGTWHFQKDDPTAFEARTNEQDQFAEPAEHQDEINAFFFVTYLMEYIDYLHVAGDNGTFGSGAFPDNYPNKTVPLPALVHFPNMYLALNVVLYNRVPDPTDPDLAYKALGMDNAFAAGVTGIYQDLTGNVAPEGVVNPTAYGHGFLFNDLALEGTVPYHEGMHAVTSPIAGLEGGPEASAMNEGQADMWAFTITDNPSLGDYVVNAKGYRDRARSLGRDPDSIAYIRSARSTLKYSDIGTFGWPAEAELVPVFLPAQPARFDFEEHYDGEIFMSTMWDIREMMNRVYPEANSYKRPRPSDGAAQKAIKQGTEIFERDFLGTMYVLGTTAPDTFVKARDAMLVADQMLYPSDSTNPAAPGRHHALIEQIWAAKELGINAKEVNGGGQATISTQVSYFSGEQEAPAIPERVDISSAGHRALRVSWNGVDHAVAYQVLKRRIDMANNRQPNGKRVYLDGDATTTGYRHVAFVDGDTFSYTDQGPVHEVFAPEGLNDLFDSEYVVRAIGVNPTGQLGWSHLSQSVAGQWAMQDVTSQVDAAISNITFSNGVMAFDNKLTNTRGAFSFDQTVYSPLAFQIVSISNPMVTVRNPDEGTNIFVYNQTLPLGATSAAKRLEFNDPGGQLFTFDARITGGAFFSTKVTGEQPGDGPSAPPPAVTYSIFRETKTGTLLFGEPSQLVTGSPSSTYGDPAFKGITWDDIEVVTKGDTMFIDAKLSSAMAVDMDFELRTEDGQVIASANTESANERFTVPVQPNTRYFFRVLGWAHGPAQYTIVSNQLLPNGSPNANAGTTTVGGTGGAPSGATNPLSGLFRFTVNPILRRVTFILLR